MTELANVAESQTYLPGPRPVFTAARRHGEALARWRAVDSCYIPRVPPNLWNLASPFSEDQASHNKRCLGAHTLQSLCWLSFSR